jgi:hypothetical protein
MIFLDTLGTVIMVLLGELSAVPGQIPIAMVFTISRASIVMLRCAPPEMPESSC